MPALDFKKGAQTMEANQKTKGKKSGAVYDI